ncbi:MAG TPA: RHS repeat-associated core domain-containing protein, partial [Chloroflexia bacterium]|nr:RHS repeat-associated core domain-containing protein [Chloroflexia bacterium]
NPFGYAGQLYDSPTGLLYMRARFYDPLTQQFISKDPADGASGSTYVYAGGDPVNYSDPQGTTAWPSSLLMDDPIPIGRLGGT